VKEKLFTSKGFTIIELLVVIAIIGVLASVVIGSLGNAREEGLSTKVKSELVILSKRAKVDELQNLTYDVVCGSNGFSTSSEIVRIITSIEQFSPEAVVCNSDTDVFAVSASTASGTYWCVDSTGASRDVSNQLETDPPEFVCPQ
jgi:prepilin-type N-terminal cleavage/methylation domain-containing protein